MDFKSLHDSHLVALLGESNPHAFKEIYERYWYYLYRLAAVKTGRKDVAEEMAQQLFEVLWMRREQLRIDNLKAYLTASLKNLVIDYVRRNLRETHYLEQLRACIPPSYADGMHEVQFNELSAAITEKLEQLPGKTRQVFMLSRFEQRSVPEIAAQLNLSEKAIEYHLTRALAFLRTHLREYISLLLVMGWL